MVVDYFNLTLAVALGIVSALFFTGRSDSLIKMFSGKTGDPRKGWSKEKKKKYNVSMGIFAGALAAGELVMALFSRIYLMTSVIVMILMIVVVVVMFRYFKKNF